MLPVKSLLPSGYLVSDEFSPTLPDLPTPVAQPQVQQQQQSTIQTSVPTLPVKVWRRMQSGC
jgi:hypothetical protein